MDSRHLHECRICAVIFENFGHDKALRAIQLLDKVNDGQVVDNFDLAFLNKVFLEIHDLMPLFSRHSEYHGVAAQMLGLYEDIANKAFDNEVTGSGVMQYSTTGDDNRLHQLGYSPINIT